MIDTVKAHVDWPMTNWLADDWIFSENYDKVFHPIKNEVVTAPRKFYATHRSLQIKFEGRQGSVNTVKCSLPRVASGDNSKLLRSQEDLDASINTLREVCAKICNPKGGIQHFKRVDLTLDFKCDPAAVIAAHRHCRYPGTSGDKYRSLSESSACWEYSGRRFAFYDKGRERAMKNGDGECTSNILRVELQLKSSVLKSLLGKTWADYPKKLDFEEAYASYREQLLSFAPPLMVANPKNKYQALALLDSQGVHVHGQLPSELFTSHLKPRTRLAWRKQISKAHLAEVSWNWADILPEQAPPPFIDSPPQIF